MFYICIYKIVMLYVPRYVVRVNKIQLNYSEARELRRVSPLSY